MGKEFTILIKQWQEEDRQWYDKTFRSLFVVLEKQASKSNADIKKIKQLREDLEIQWKRICAKGVI